MMQKSNRNPLSVLTAILLIGICYIVSYIFLIPKYTSIRQDLAQKEAEVTAAAAKRDSLAKSKETLNGLGSIVDQLFVSMPIDKDEPNLIAELEAIAAKNKTYIPSIQISDGKADINKNLLTTVSFSVNGSFSDLNQFISSLENNIKFFSIKSMSLTTAGSDVVSLSISMDAYRLPDNSYSLSTRLDPSSSSQNIIQ
ncbi:MAG: type 4a pilus biogenesis protein PilO [Patescibacteria group bacterium]